MEKSFTEDLIEELLKGIVKISKHFLLPPSSIKTKGSYLIKVLAGKFSLPKGMQLYMMLFICGSRRALG